MALIRIARSIDIGLPSSEFLLASECPTSDQQPHARILILEHCRTV